MDRQSKLPGLLVNKHVVLLSADALARPPLPTVIREKIRAAEGMLTTYNLSFKRVSLSVPTSKVTARDRAGFIPVNSLIDLIGTGTEKFNRTHV